MTFINNDRFINFDFLYFEGTADDIHIAALIIFQISTLSPQLPKDGTHRSPSCISQTLDLVRAFETQYYFPFSS